MEDRGVMPLDRARAVAADLLDILEDVHAQGIAHNDIKPDNILFDGGGRARLIDFGIAWDFLRDRDELRGGVRVGSEGYIAPELLAGGTPSALSDLYSFGVVFSQMLGGRPAATGGEAAGLRSIPRQYLPFLERCLAADPGGRFASAGAARAALAGIAAAQERAITLDIEGTLVTDYGSRHPRPGLAGFIDFCLRHFDRIFVYTSLTAEQAREVFGHLLGTGAVPAAFCDRYEYVEWPRGDGGSIKDLRRCGFPIEHNAIVDDMEVMIPDDQRHRWVPVPNYSVPGHAGQRVSHCARGSSEQVRDHVMNMKSHSATRAGLSDPSALTVWDMVTSTLPFSFSSTPDSFMTLRILDPDGTGLMKRILLNP